MAINSYKIPLLFPVQTEGKNSLQYASATVSTTAGVLCGRRWR